jgi:hypothetical protein
LISFVKITIEDATDVIGKKGKYGIWGHSIGDLVLIDADVDAKGNITLGVDS